MPGSSVVLIGSVSGVSGAANFGTYGATKAALRSYARTWTAELVPRGIRVNVVSPGPTATEMFAALPDEARAHIAGVELFVDGGAVQV